MGVDPLDGDGYGYGSGDGSGSGYGYGSGDGSGYGSGSGDGYGYGYGDGDGSGYGSGSGDGSGYGSGYGSGSGDGYGYGYGSGYGSGDGYGYGWKLIAEALCGPGALWWRSNAEGKPCNGGSGDAVRVGLVQETPKAELCKTGFHATANPDKWKGERWWIVRLEGVVQDDGEKSVGTKRTILAEFGR